jgi:GNAT superfamily N-acetyltransferase
MGELERWARFCAARGFAHRGGAPDRFLTKFVADPARRIDWTLMGLVPRQDVEMNAAPVPEPADPSLVPGPVVPLSEGAEETGTEPTIVGSVRMFDRTVDVNGRAVRQIGWGEVCTDPFVRGRGVAAAVLGRALAVMEGDEASSPSPSPCSPALPFSVSLLHAAIPVMPLYEKYGYRSIVTENGWLKLGGEGEEGGTGVSFRRASLPRPGPAGSEDPDGDIPALQRVHRATFSGALCGVTGWVHRGGDEGASSSASASADGSSGGGSSGGSLAPGARAYWREWIPHATKGALWVAEKDGAVLAYAAAHWRNDSLRLVDFGIDEGRCEGGGGGGAGASRVVRALLRAAYQGAWLADRPVGAGAAPGGGSGAGGELRAPALLVPVPVLAWIVGRDAARDSVSPADCDPGWMVRPLGEGAGGEEAARALVEAGREGRFLILGVDGF